MLQKEFEAARSELKGYAEESARRDAELTRKAENTLKVMSERDDLQKKFDTLTLNYQVEVNSLRAHLEDLQSQLEGERNALPERHLQVMAFETDRLKRWEELVMQKEASLGQRIQDHLTMMERGRNELKVEGDILRAKIQEDTRIKERSIEAARARLDAERREMSAAVFAERAAVEAKEQALAVERVVIEESTRRLRAAEARLEVERTQVTPGLNTLKVAEVEVERQREQLRAEATKIEEISRRIKADGDLLGVREREVDSKLNAIVTRERAVASRESDIAKQVDYINRGMADLQRDRMDTHRRGLEVSGQVTYNRALMASRIVNFGGGKIVNLASTFDGNGAGMVSGGGPSAGPQHNEEENTNRRERDTSVAPRTGSSAAVDLLENSFERAALNLNELSIRSRESNPNFYNALREKMQVQESENKQQQQQQRGFYDALSPSKKGRDGVVVESAFTSSSAPVTSTTTSTSSARQILQSASLSSTFGLEAALAAKRLKEMRW